MPVYLGKVDPAESSSYLINKNQYAGISMNIKRYFLPFGFVLLTITGCSSKLEREFVNGCKAAGAQGSACKCLYKKLEKKYGEEGLKQRINNVDQSRSLQDAAIQASFQCAMGE